MSELIDKLGNASRAVYIACPKEVADDISGLLRKAGERIAQLEAAGNSLLHQIDINDFEDSNGHDLKMLKAVHDLLALLQEQCDE
jgi:hypothetical protein